MVTNFKNSLRFSSRGSRGKTGTLRIKVHKFDTINVKKKFKLGYIRINSLLNSSIHISIF